MKRLPALALVFSLIASACVSRSDFQAAQSEAQEAQAEATGLASKLEAKEAELVAAQEQIAQLDTDLESARAAEQAAKREASKLSAEVDKYLCDSQINDMKYDDVMSASTILSAWFATRPDTKQVHTPYRDKIWNNALSQLHGITYTSEADNQQYVEHFMVYFDEFGFTPSVFWIGGQCWLDPP
jgi:outer membrane murein-binding lipoprotein Lpp